MESKYKIGIVIPMYNEETNAKRCVDQVVKKIKALPYDIHLFIVNDGSTDKTITVLNSLLKIYRNKLQIVSYKKNQGYGKAIQNGTIAAIKKRCSYVLYMDSDLTNNPSDIIKFLKMLRHQPDCIKGSRYIEGGSMINVPVKRQIISQIGNTIASILFKTSIKDCTNGFRMIHVNTINNINFKEKSFSIIMEEFYYLRKMNASILEVPIVLTSRKKGKTHFTYSVETIYNYIKYPVRFFFNI